MTPQAKRTGPTVVDSSAWLQYFADGSGAKHFAGVVEAVDRPVVPAICLLEVFKVMLIRQTDDNDALQTVALMQQGNVVDLDASLEWMAAKAGIEHKLPLAASAVC